MLCTILHGWRGRASLCGLTQAVGLFQVFAGVLARATIEGRQ